MFKFGQILVSTLVLGASAVSLSGCGQQGALYLPTEPAAKHRATLPELLLPLKPSKPQAPTPTDATPAKPLTPISAPQ